MSDVKRYWPNPDGPWVDMVDHKKAIFEQEANGYVTSDDHDTAIAAKDAEIAELRAELSVLTERFSDLRNCYTARGETIVLVARSRDEARECVGRLYGTVETLRFHLRRDDHVTPPTARTATMEMIDACDAALSATPEHLRK